ncbi:MAG TPA: glycosyltransferase family 39 protein [Bryobacteraceae bacterium]|nr:glycosyltransferase family 39 protein [Bryobacteraceae bacterium]
MPRRVQMVILLACLAAGLRLLNLRNVNSRTPDERVYTYQAKTVLDQGPAAGMRSLIAEYKADPDAKLYPPPTRAGMIRLLAAVMRATRHYGEGVGAAISCAASIGSVVVLALLAVRFLPPWAAAIAMLLYAVLPADLAIARRTWTDGLVELAGLLMIWFACEVTRRPQRRLWLVLLAIAGGLSLTVKESMPVPWAFCGLWMLWILARKQLRANVAILLASSAVAAGFSLWWLAGQVGSLHDYIAIVSGIPAANAANEYALEYASGPAYLLLKAFWIIAPMTSLLAVVGAAIVFLRKRESALIFITGFSAAYIALAMAMPHWINLRYVGNTFGPVCLLAGLGAWWLIETGSEWIDATDRRPFAAVAIAIIIGGAAADYIRFRNYFVRDEVVDLSIKWLTDERNQ